MAGVFPLVGALASAWWISNHGVDPTHLQSLHPGAILNSIVRHPIATLALLQIGYLLLQTILWLRYRPVLPGTDDELPAVSVIIPAYNEGAMVARSITSVLESDYPAHLLEIIVVDDGSRDDTYFHMEHLRRTYAGRLRLLRFAGNQGKRAALVAGFRAARGSVAVTIDSDSMVERGTLRAMAAPLHRDPTVGAVAGRVAVLNRSDLIGAMLDVQYALAFDFGRASQSVFRAVACCPGALSAFRLAVILPHLDQWVNQRFLGRPVAHGEDQALTNIVLRAGYDTVYQGNAVIHTLAPQRYRQLCRMFLRWERSYLVEGFSFARFMFTRYRPHQRLLPILNFFLCNLRIVLLYVGLVQAPLLILERPGRLGDFFIAMCITATFTAFYHLRNERSLRFGYGVLYAFYSLFLLQWIFPWAVVTVRDERWGTR